MFNFHYINIINHITPFLRSLFHNSFSLYNNNNNNNNNNSNNNNNEEDEDHYKDDDCGDIATVRRNRMFTTIQNTKMAMYMVPDIDVLSK